MEMYADEDSRGGVLEPEGIVGIKYRREKQLETMARLDPTYGKLRAQLNDKNLSHEAQSDIKVKMTQREKLLGPVYLQIALQFADLHDRAGRMEYAIAMEECETILLLASEKKIVRRSAHQATRGCFLAREAESQCYRQQGAAFGNAEDLVGNA
jgi:Carboxyl transferase domain